MTHELNSEWFLLDDQGQPRGPLSADQIRVEIQNRRLGPQNVIRRADQPEGWDYVFSFVEFKQAMPKPVVPKKTVPVEQPVAVQESFLSGTGALNLKVILHDNVRIVEGQVEMLAESQLIIGALASSKFELGQKLFVHLYDPVKVLSVNLWAEVSKRDGQQLALKFNDLPLNVLNKYHQILEFCRANKAA